MWLLDVIVYDTACLPPTLLDAPKLWKKCWDQIEPSLVASCWVHTHCLPLPNEATLVSETCNYRSVSPDDIVNKLRVQLSSLIGHHTGTADVLDSLGLSTGQKSVLYFRGGFIWKRILKSLLMLQWMLLR